MYLLTHQLANTEEYVDGALAGHLGEVLIRYITLLTEDEEKLIYVSYLWFIRERLLFESGLLDLVLCNEGLTTNNRTAALFMRLFLYHVS